jgi:amino acid permease
MSTKALSATKDNSSYATSLEEDTRPRNAGLLPSIFNLTKTAIGMGMLAIPAAYKSLGLIPGITLTIFAMLLGCLSLHFLRRVGEHTQKYSYPGTTSRLLLHADVLMRV